jgi:hypothetical protein
MRTRRMTQLEIMRFYQREVNKEAERRQQKENKKRNIFARLVGIK